MGFFGLPRISNPCPYRLPLGHPLAGTDPKHLRSTSAYSDTEKHPGALFYFVAPVLEGISVVDADLNGGRGEGRTLAPPTRPI